MLEGDLVSFDLESFPDGLLDAELEVGELGGSELLEWLEDCLCPEEFSLGHFSDGEAGREGLLVGETVVALLPEAVGFEVQLLLVGEGLLVAELEVLVEGGPVYFL